MTVRMDNGDESTVGPGDGFHMPARQDAWTVGNKPCVLTDTTRVKAYAWSKQLPTAVVVQCEFPGACGE